MMVERVPDDGEAPIIVGVAEAAMHMYVSAIDALPHQNDLEFRSRAEVILVGLRKLRSSLTDAGERNRLTPSVAGILSKVRQLYDDLMLKVAGGPAATLGEQLYVVRRRALLSTQEAANGTGLDASVLDDLEEGELPTEDEAVKIKALIECLGGLPEIIESARAMVSYPVRFDDDSVTSLH